MVTQPNQVAPHAGAWIETRELARIRTCEPVAPHAGAWIETGMLLNISIKLLVAPHAGAWIETAMVLTRASNRPTSRPTRARGLKRRCTAPRLRGQKTTRPPRARGLKHRGRRPAHIGADVAPHAGAWIETSVWFLRRRPIRVAPHAGAWIETSKRREKSVLNGSRAPRGRVD